MNFNRAKLFILGFLTTAFVAGCSTVAEKIVEKPKVSLDKVDVTDVGVTGAVVLFNVRVANPNNFPLKVDSVKYDVEIGGNRLGGGKLDKGARVDAKSESVIQIPVPVKYTEAFSSVMSFLTEGKSKYRIRGDAAIGPLTVPFDKTGDLKIEKPK